MVSWGMYSYVSKPFRRQSTSAILTLEIRMASGPLDLYMILQHRDDDDDVVWTPIAQMGPMDGPSVHQVWATNLKEILRFQVVSSQDAVLPMWPGITWLREMEGRPDTSSAPPGPDKATLDESNEPPPEPPSGDGPTEEAGA
jgi:hypothetical protein